MRNNRMWFGTEERSRWIPAPNSPAETTPVAWETSDTYLNGGGFVRHSWGSHKEFVYEWPESSSLQAAQIMKSYRDGSYGRGLLHFIDPLIYDKNILPARWADPTMTVGYEGVSLVTGVDPEAVPTSGGAANDLPVWSAYYNLNDAPAWKDNSVFIPIPEGYTLYLGAMYQATGAGGVFVTPINSSGGEESYVVLDPISNDATNVVDASFGSQFSGGRGVRLWVGKYLDADASVTVSAMTARILPTGTTPSSTFLSGPWVGGMGHSGCQFMGVPTLVEISGVNGGQVGYAASFAETGDFQ